MTFVFIIGVLCTLLTLKLISNAVKFRSQSKVVAGEVVELDEQLQEREVESSSLGDDGVSVSSSRIETYKMYTPIIEFTASNGKKYKHRHSSSSSSPSHKIGDKVKIAYLPDNPEESKEASFFGHWLGSIFMTCFSAVMILISYQSVFDL